MRKVLLVGTIVATLSLGVWAAKAEPHPSRRATAGWEYQEIHLSASAIATQTLNKYGGEGWELVNVVSACAGATPCVWWAYFKRPR